MVQYAVNKDGRSLISLIEKNKPAELPGASIAEYTNILQYVPRDPDQTETGLERRFRDSKWTGGSHEIRNISVCSDLVFFLEYR
jgi:hypothetical protein